MLNSTNFPRLPTWWMWFVMHNESLCLSTGCLITSLTVFGNAKPLRAVEYHSFHAFDVIVIHAYEPDDGSADSVCNRAHWLGPPTEDNQDGWWPGWTGVGRMWLFVVSEHMYRATCTTFAICRLLDVLYIFNQIRSTVILVNARICEPLIRIYGEDP